MQQADLKLYPSKECPPQPTSKQSSKQRGYACSNPTFPYSIIPQTQINLITETDISTLKRSQARAQLTLRKPLK